MDAMKTTHILLLLALLSLAAGCASPVGSSGAGSSGTQNPCDKQSSIKGRIVTISHGTAGGGIALDGTKEPQAAYDKIYVLVNPNTLLFEKQGKECRAVSSAALKVGQRVQVQSTGSVMQSYPPQTNAAEIVILLPGS